MQLDKFHMDGPDKVKVSLVLTADEAHQFVAALHVVREWNLSPGVKELFGILGHTFEMAGLGKGNV